MPKVRIPTPLQGAFGNRSEVDCPGDSLDAVISNLETRHPGIRARLCDADGKLRRFLNVYVNDTDVRTLQGGATALKPTDEVSIIPAIAGGGPVRR
jgi:molybdopterin converting factor small subunit